MEFFILLSAPIARSLLARFLSPITLELFVFSRAPSNESPTVSSLQRRNSEIRADGSWPRGAATCGFLERRWVGSR